MTLKDVLLQVNTRITVGNKWLVINDDGLFEVYEHRYRARNTKLLVTTDDQDLACRTLIDESRNHEMD